MSDTSKSPGNNQQTETGSNAPGKPMKSNGKRRRVLIILGIIVLIVGISWLAYWFFYARWYETTDDAYAQGNVVSIVPQTMGTVVSIDADNGMKVEAGQALVHLDPNDAQVAYEQAIANLAGSVRQVRGLYSNVEAGQADINARQVAVQQARADVNRRVGLVASGAVSREELAHARDVLAGAEAALSGAKNEQSRSVALVDATTLRTQPQVQSAAAQLRRAYLDLQRAAIVAPVSGYVAERTVQLGQRVQPGTTLMTIVPLDQVWIEANFKETQLTDMRIGQAVELESDLYGGDVTFRGHVSSFGLGTGSAFSLLPAQNATGNWIKIVQRVPVRIDVDPRQLARHPLRIGLSMSVAVDIHDTSGSVLAGQATHAQPLLATDAYDQQLHDANAVIDGIIEQNLPKTTHD